MNRLAASPLLFAGLFASAPLLAAPQAVDSRISAVTVYADRAVVTRTARLQLPKGQHEIALEQLPFQLDDTSLRASLGASAAATPARRQQRRATGRAPGRQSCAAARPATARDRPATAGNP
ncbi:DUF4140 domain-containing protein [Pseudomonas aeruginosa]|nr:DUF4140 domain-containing protein [Pseudomonas aeruginosa]